MAKKSKELSALEVGRINEIGYHHVGGVAGLVLQVTKTGSKSWLLRVLVGGKRREIGLGGFPDVTLAGAREKARELREKIRDGIDPVAERQAARNALAAAVASAISFQQAAERYIAANETGWKNEKHRHQWTSSLETHVYPKIGKLPVSAIEKEHVISIIEPMWSTLTETASRLRGRIENVLDWATVRGYRKEGENPARWRGNLEHLLPARNDVQKVVHHSALDYRTVGAFMAALREVEGMGARALEFAILTAARSGEVRGATWNEIDRDAGLWIIPEGRMKAEKEHTIPLSVEALTLLDSSPRMVGCDLIFPNASNGVLSDMTLTAVIRRMDEASTKAGGTGWKDRAGKTVTAHGFRSTFRDWAGETTAFPREVIEHALAHQLKDKAEAAYQRGTLLEKRRRLMGEWARHCAVIQTTTGVTPIRKATA